MRCHPLALLPPILLLLGCARSPRADAARTHSAASTVSADGPSAGADTAALGGSRSQRPSASYSKSSTPTIAATSTRSWRPMRPTRAMSATPTRSLSPGATRCGRGSGGSSPPPKVARPSGRPNDAGRLRHLASNCHQHAGGQDQYGGFRLRSARGEDRPRLGHPLSTGPGSRPDRQSVTVKPGHDPWLDTWCPRPTMLLSRRGAVRAAPATFAHFASAAFDRSMPELAETECEGQSASPVGTAPAVPRSACRRGAFIASFCS